MKERDVSNISVAIRKMGFVDTDYKIIHFGANDIELKVTNEELHWFIKSFSKLNRAKTKTKQ